MRPAMQRTNSLRAFWSVAVSLVQIRSADVSAITYSERCGISSATDTIWHAAKSAAVAWNTNRSTFKPMNPELSRCRIPPQRKTMLPSTGNGPSLS